METKQRFLEQNITGRTRDQIINTLVGKINDELLKGGFAAQNREAIITGMGGNTMITTAPAGQQPVSAGVAGPKQVDFGMIDDSNGPESKMYFVVIGILLLTVGVITWIFYKPKKRRR